ncbi:hypothetical protein F5X99DRAFT_426900 [Biscogniauxia marginata]|nr:hypothetical protein F5X99DRAFT_426900 [Biscogniauxia marginata]
MSSIDTLPTTAITTVSLSGSLFLIILFFLSLSSTTIATPNADCAAASLSTSFILRFISYGNYTALPSQGDDTAVPRFESVSFAVANAANGVETLCAFALPLSDGGGGGNSSSSSNNTSSSRNNNSRGYGGMEAGPGVGAWQPCADRKDTDGKHQYTIATGAGFGIVGGRVAVNQTWFCHDEEGRLVAYTGVARGILDMTCTEGKISGYHLQNCTAPDTRLPVTLL